MNIFRTYFKLAKTVKGSIIVPFIIFIAFSSIFLTEQKINEDAAAYSRKSTLALFNHAEQENQNLQVFLKENFDLKTIADNDEAMKDALFFGHIDYALIIEKDGLQGYHMAFSSKGYIANSQLEEFLSLHDIYQEFLGSKPNFITQTLKKNSPVHFAGNEDAAQATQIKNKLSYFNYSGYMLLAVLITVSCSIAAALRKKGIRERLKLSNTSANRIEVELMAGNMILLLLMVGIIFVLPRIFTDNILIFSNQNILLLINILAFGLSIIGLGLLLSRIFNNNLILTGISLLISLSFSFLSGIFVPQELLPAISLNIAKFFPAYWFVKANETIIKAQPSSNEPLSYLNCLGIILLMGLVYFVITATIGKKKKFSLE